MQKQGGNVKKIIFLLLAVCLTVAVGAQEAQAPKAASVSAPTVMPVVVSPQVQSQVDAAWKDLQIAQLKLQLAIEQALGTAEKGTYYDYGQQKFLRRVDSEKESEKPGVAAAPATAKK